MQAHTTTQPTGPALRHASLFAGIGGFDLAAQRVGWHNVLHCEINPFCQRVLRHYWPNAISYADITKTNFEPHRGAVDVLSGGFPCQPYSTAGLRLGKADARHLWPQMLRAIREIEPTWVVGENVRGLLNWNGGLVFAEVLHDLEAAGYEVCAFLLPAAGVGAPHERYRVWIVAHRAGIGCKQPRPLRNGGDGLSYAYSGTNAAHPSGTGWAQRYNGPQPATQEYAAGLLDEIIAHTNGRRLEGLQNAAQTQQPAHRNPWSEFPAEPPVCSRNDGLSSRLDGITFPSWREQSIRAYGNAVVPYLVEQIYRVINTIHHSPI